MRENVTTLADSVKTLYERQLQARALPRLVHGGFGRPASWKGYGSYELRKYASLEVVSSALSEGVTPIETGGPTISTTTITPAWYGAWIGHTDKILTTTYDPIIGETVELLGEQCADSFDRLIRASLIAGATPDYAGSAASRAGISATNDRIAFSDYIYQVAALKAAHVRPADGADIPVIMHPYTWATLMQDSTFVAMFTREADGNAYRNGRMGRILETSLYVSGNAATTASTTTVYHSLFIGRDAYGLSGFTGLQPNYRSNFGAGEYSNETGQTHRPIQIIAKDLGETGFDPLNQRGTLAWKATHDCTVLDATWLRNLEHATVASA